jgi:hypothetical protein
MILPKNAAYPNFNEVHREDDWCAKAGCLPVCDASVVAGKEIAEPSAVPESTAGERSGNADSLVDDCAVTIIADALSGKDPGWLVNRVAARINTLLSVDRRALAGTHPQPTDDYTESAYQALRQQMLREVDFWQGEHARVVADISQLKDRILNVLDELTPEDADASHPVAIAYQKVADVLNGAHPSLGEAAQPPFWSAEAEKQMEDALAKMNPDHSATYYDGFREGWGLARAPKTDADAPQPEGKA